MPSTGLVWLAAFALFASAIARAAAADLDILLFGSLDGGAESFATVGAKAGFSSFDDSGFVALWSVGGGMRHERMFCGCGSRATFTRLSQTVSELFGYQWIIPEGAIAVYAGSETDLDALVGVAAVLRTGWRLQGETWLRPTEDSLFQTTVIAGTARNSLWMRAAWGYKLAGAYLGPEGSASLNETGYRKVSFGVHATDVAVAEIRLRVAAGLQWETHRAGPRPYLGLAAWSPL
ncbi:cellulose biosynthesis protein BcsS [Methylobacterium sp. NFXW15]|uniref:cellulose biosynthesis protein BcsS n=1 Tax=Methylobacterium sp. NFXW15 TaxID=2819512 RepID=UPI003CEC826A